MPSFAFLETVPGKEIVSACLGPDANTKFKTADVGKPVKLGTAQNFVLCADTNEIEGFVTSVEAPTYNNGFSFGGVQRWGWATAQVAAGAIAVAVGDYVVAGAQTALGTAGLPQIKGGTPTKFLWRVYRLLGANGNPGSQVLLYREG
jgi:hypothetical protein